MLYIIFRRFIRYIKSTLVQLHNADSSLKWHVDMQVLVATIIAIAHVRNTNVYFQ